MLQKYRYMILFMCKECPQSIGQILLWNGSTNFQERAWEQYLD